MIRAHKQRALRAAEPMEEFRRDRPEKCELIVRHRGHKTLIEPLAEDRIQPDIEALGETIEREFAIAAELPVLVFVCQNLELFRRERELFDIVESPLSGMLFMLAGFLKRDPVICDVKRACGPITPMAMANLKTERLRRK
jgi:hypothetical protein